MFRSLLLIFLVCCSLQVRGQSSDSGTQSLAVGQGVSSPVMTSTTLFSKGFTLENPVAAAYQNGYRGTVAADGSDSTSFGLDFGVGDSQYGVALGMYSNGCDGCDGFIRGSLGVIFGSFGFGFGVQENLYTLGVLVNPNGLHRVGLVYEIQEPDGQFGARNGFALGYSYVLPQITFTFDVSNQSFDNPLRESGALMFSPGMAVRVDIFSVSLTYDFYMSDESRTYSDDDGVWVGLSAKPWSDIEITFYGEYVDRWALLGTYYF